MDPHSPAYNELTWRCFAQPLNMGELRGLGVGHAAAGSVEQGTWVQFHVQILRGHITAAKFRAFGCPHVIAIASWLTEHSIGQCGDAALPESLESLQRRFELPVAKRGRLLLIEDAWSGAIRHAVTKSGAAMD